jgi:hypothetical protein
VLPHVPIRQWVFTVPVPVRYQLAFDAGLTRAVLRLFLRTVFNWRGPAGCQRRALWRGHRHPALLLAIERKEAGVWAAFASTVRLAVDRGAVRPIVRDPVRAGAQAPVGGREPDHGSGREGHHVNPIDPPGHWPGTSPDQLSVLREAFAKAMRDPELRAEADKAQIDF